MKKRPVDLVVISDVHLGTYGCHAKELAKYLKSIKPKKVILNGDIIDIWQFSIVNKVLLNLNGKKAWLFHGDVFDVTMQHSKWIAKLGAKGYDLLILINRTVNFFSIKLGYGRLSMSKKIKNSVKSAVKFINNFEQIVTDIAIENKYDYVVCGHIHQPEIRDIENPYGKVKYLNSGDWIENLTALEYHKGKWSLYQYEQDLKLKSLEDEITDQLEIKENSELFKNLMEELQIQNLQMKK